MNNPRTPGRPGLSRGAPQPPPGRAGRAYQPKPAANNPLPLILGIGGGILAIILIFVVMSSGDKQPAPVEAPPPPEVAPPPPKPVDVSGLEREGLKACGDALTKFRSIEPKMSADLSAMSDANRESLKSDLQGILEGFRKGMAYLNEANEKSGRGYDVKDYMQARKLAADKFKQLGGKLEQH